MLENGQRLVFSFLSLLLCLCVFLSPGSCGPAFPCTRTSSPGEGSSGRAFPASRAAGLWPSPAPVPVPLVRVGRAQLVPAPVPRLAEAPLVPATVAWVGKADTLLLGVCPGTKGRRRLWPSLLLHLYPFLGWEWLASDLPQHYCWSPG